MSSARFSCPETALREIFGYAAFRGKQKEIIEAVCAGESACALMPTGSGKSLCYQIPALCRNGTALVVSPLIALMDDQVLALNETGVKAAALHSGLGDEEARAVYRDLRQGDIDMLYVAPERLVNPRFAEFLDTLDLALLAVDEAHCISQWGHDFRPEYRQITAFRERRPDVPCIAVTATADKPTRKEILERLRIGRLAVGGFDRPNIFYRVVEKENAFKQLLAFLEEREAGESGIIYCLSRKKTEETAEKLRAAGYDAAAYHAGLSPEERASRQNRFLKEEGVIMSATVAFGMGINKPDVRFVAHLDMPKNIESYYQETGRAGRDGLPATAWMAYGAQDAMTHARRIDESEAPEERKRVERHKLDAFLAFCEAATCRRQMLLRYFSDDCEPCGACDTCVSPPETFDGTVTAQKLLSAVYRTGQRFGAGYVIDILRGADSGRAAEFGHTGLSVFGIGAEHNMRQWRSAVRQLLGRGLLGSDPERFNALYITEAGKRFLKKKETITLRPLTAGKKERMGAAAVSADTELTDPQARALFIRLKALRTALAKEHNVPPYVIFHDKTLIDMAMRAPANEDELARVPGVGASKLARYGDAFLEEIRGARAAG